jgi:hypothetical protein
MEKEDGAGNIKKSGGNASFITAEYMLHDGKSFKEIYEETGIPIEELEHRFGKPKVKK